MVDLKWDSVLFSKKTARDWKAVVFFCLSCISFFLDYGYIFMCFQEQQINDDNDHERITHAYYSFTKKRKISSKKLSDKWIGYEEDIEISSQFSNVMSVFFFLLVYLILFQQSRYNHKRWRYKHERRMESEWGALCRHAHFLTIWNSMKFHGMNSRAEKEKKLYI